MNDIEIKRELGKKYYNKEMKARYYRENREKLLEQRKQYIFNNPEKIKEENKISYAKRKAKRDACHETMARFREQTRQQYIKFKDKIIERQRLKRLRSKNA